MKKFLFFLLITLIAADTQIHENEEISINEKLADVISKLPQYLQKFFDWICKNDFWRELSDKLLEEGRNAALEFCVSLSNIPTLQSWCNTLVDALYNLFHPGD